MENNKIFEAKATLNNVDKIGNAMVSKVRVNREYLISKEIAEEMNTYISFNPFPTFNDYFAPKYDDKGNEITTKDMKVGTPGVRSIFNKAGAVIIGDTSTTQQNIMMKEASHFRISNNVPLMDNRATRKAIRAESGCTVKELVQASQNGLLGREVYSYSDFMYCKYLGRMSNNYMVTLRRFPYPVDDYISSIGVGSERQNADLTSQNTDSLGCMITWMGTPGNEMQNILKYSMSMPYTQKKAELQNDPVDADSGGGFANQVAAIFDPVYRDQYQNSQASTQANAFFKQYMPPMIAKHATGDAAYQAKQWNDFKDSTKAYGPVDTIKETYARSEDGLQFNQTMSLTFEYELRSYNGINGRQAMLDLLSNILNVTYSTGTFWGGGFRGGGAHQNNIFNNLQIYKAKGGFTNFVDAFTEDCSTIGQSLGQTIKDNGGFWATIKQFANSLTGMLMHGALNKLGRPQKHRVTSLLSPAPVGFWHVTVGNPHHPIMSMGNMILKTATVEHYGPLGLDDFPTCLKVTCELERGKPRDIRDIEKLYMHGNDRIYTSMGPKIFDMYKHAKEYGDKNSRMSTIIGNANSTVSVGDGKTETIDNINHMKHVLQKYFGHADTTSIMIASMEQENGAHARKKKGTAGGDSSVPGTDVKM